MDYIKNYLSALSVEQIQKLRKRMYRTILFTRNKQYAELLGMLDTEMMHYLVSQSNNTGEQHEAK